MEQIKNYLSQVNSFDKIILLSSTPEFEDLKKWIIDNKISKNIIDKIDEITEFNNIDAIIFDYDQSYFLKEKPHIYCNYLIGRIRKEEDEFTLWEEYRTKTNIMYFDRKKGLNKEEITSERPNSEILFWEKEESGIELSVIIPVYNVVKYLPQCIETLTKWKAPYIEYLFINDGSTDDSEEVIKKYESTDRRIHLITKENGGCASARNRGLKEARGKYVSFIDSDDYVDERMLYKLFSRALQGGYDIAYCGYNEYEEQTGKSVPVKNDCLSAIYTEGIWNQDKVQILSIKTRIAIWRCIYKKELLKRSNIYFHEELKRFDDLSFRVETLFTAKSVVCIPEYLYYYRLGRIGQDVSCTDKRLYVHFQIFDGLDLFVDQLHNVRLKDLLQIIKIHTHGFGLCRIEKKYKKEYVYRALKQLDRNMGYFRTLGLIFMYTGKKNIFWYTWAKMKGN